MPVTATLYNNGVNITSVTYKNWVNGPMTVSLKGGQKLIVKNTPTTTDPDTGDEIPDNILNLDVVDADVLKINFVYNPKQVYIKLVTS